MWPKKFSRIVPIFVLLAMLLVIAGCNSTPSGNVAETPSTGETSQPTEPPKEELTVSIGVEPANLDPLLDAGRGTLNSNILSHVLDTLVRRDDNMETIPWLATDWKALDDNTWEFHLRQGVKFEDGEELDANAVKFTFDTIRTDPNSSGIIQSWLDPVVEVKVIDKYTFQFITDEPYPLLMAYLPNVPFILPPEYYKEHGLQTGADSFSRKPIGSGPYKITSWIPDTELVLEAKDDYWGDAPQFKKITFRPIVETSTRLAEFMTGGLDLITDLTTEQIPQVESTDFGKVVWTDTVQVRYINLRTDMIPDVQVRQALFYATDVDSIIDNLFGGYGTALKTGAAVIPAEFGWDPTIEPYPYDVDKANSLLDEAGWTDTNGDGIREKDGKKLHLDMAIIRGALARGEDVAQAVASQWAKVGVEVEIHPYERGDFRTKWFDRTLPEQTYSTSTGTQTFDADSRLINMVHTWVQTPEFSAGSVSFYSDAHIDDLIMQARTTTDLELRKTIYSEILHKLHDDAYMLSLFPDVQFQALNKCLSPWNPRVDGGVNFGGAGWNCPQ